MTLAPISIEPGIYTEASPRSALGRYVDGFNIRFFKLNPEKFGGFVQYIATPMLGICRSIISWTTLSYQRLLGFGTHMKLYLSDGASYFDITPIAASGILGADPFSTTSGSDIVTVTHTGHGRSAGDFVNFSGATATGGLTMDGAWVVDTAPDANTYTFLNDAVATSSATGGGAAVSYQYEISAGNKNSVTGTGFGAGGFGAGTFGTARTSTYLQLARIWSLVNWGEDLIASPVGREVYVWVASTGTAARAVLIPNAPAANRRVILSPQLRILISVGSHDGTNPDPMLVRWCDSEDYSAWTPSPTNAAGDKRLDNGNEIITAILSRNEIAIITDTTVYSMTLTGDDLIFAFQDMGQTPRLAGPNAACDVNGTIFAMANGSFFTYNGAVSVLPCDVHSKVFGDINFTQAAKVYCARNKLKSEVIWFYPSAASDECDKFVSVNFENPSRYIWACGGTPMDRTAWLDQNSFEVVPLATQPSGDNSLLHIQETGVDADTQPLPYHLETYEMEVPAYSSVISSSRSGAGEVIEHFRRFVPDYQRIVGNHTFTVYGRKYPTASRKTKGPKTFGPTNQHIDLHIRARQIAMRWEGNELGNDVSFGAWRVDEGFEGKR